MKKISNLTLPQKILEGICFAILAGMFLGLFLFWSRIPDQVPGHYNGAGEIDRWGSKWELLIPLGVTAFLYLLLTAICGLIWIFVRAGELPPSAYTCLAGMKLVTLGTFAVIEWRSASSQPMVGWLVPVVIVSGGVLIAGFAISCIRFAMKRSGK